MTETILLDSQAAAVEAVRRTVEAASQERGWHVQIGLAPGRDLLLEVIELQPALIVALAELLPAWIAAVRANPATRRLPVAAITQGGTVDSDLSVVRDLGIGTILSLDSLTADQLLQIARPLPDPAVLAEDCAQPLSPLALKGLEEFNAHEFFECHETLETAWNADPGPARELYRLILQVGLAYHQIERGNYAGALKMFLRTRQWFVRLPDHCRGIDLVKLRLDADSAQKHMETLGPDRIAEFDRTLIKPIVYPAYPGQSQHSEQ